jgi:glycosyltransferase involved in cell wall biosynthesis
MKRKVSIVGAIIIKALQGKTSPKIFIYRDAFEELGFETKLFSTNVKKIFFLQLIKNIKKAFIYGDTVVFMLGGKGSRQLLSLILYFKRKYKKRILLVPFGIGPLNPLLAKKDPVFVYNFINKNEFKNVKDKKVGLKLAKFDNILVQTATLKKCFETFYSIDNVKILHNCRFATHLPDFKITNSGHKSLKMIYISRITEEKGVLDLMRSVQELNTAPEGYNITLDMYGANHLENLSRELFFNLIKESNDKMRYLGTLPNDQVIDTIRKYEVSCLPTKHIGEGAPGFIIESLIAGVPIITSSFSQVNDLINDEVEGLIFELGNTDSLKNSILKLLNKKEIVTKMSKNALKTGQQYTFEYNEERIKTLIIGGTIQRN